MCKLNRKSGNRRIDPCMREFIKSLNWIINEDNFEIVSCCCGHGKYPMTVVFRRKGVGWYYELFSGVSIPRKKRFYIKDNQGYYYIPEVIKNGL